MVRSTRHGLGPCIVALLSALGCGAEGETEKPDATASVQQRVEVLAVTAVADTELRASAPFSNFGTAPNLRVTSASVVDLRRSMVRFDTAAIQTAVGAQALHSARLDLSINGISAGWLGGQIEIMPMARPWVEGTGLLGEGPSWVCRHDTDTTLFGNLFDNCASTDHWGMLPTDPYPQPFDNSATDRARIFTGGVGTLSLDVTGDVARFLSGDENHGWILAGTGGPMSGEWVDFSSRQGSNPPRLVLEIGPDECEGDPLKGVPGECGCGVPDTDANFDGVVDCVDATAQATADTTLRLAVPFGNDGTGTLLGVTSASIAGLERSLVRVDTEAIDQARKGRPIDTAVLELTVAGISLGWGGGRLEILPMTRDWPEGTGLAGHGPSWYCADDQDTTVLGNLVNHCAPGDEWGMEFWQFAPIPFSTPPTDTQPLLWPGARSVRFDVTEDVRRFVAGEPNHGWIVKGTEDLLSGEWVNFGSRESGAPPTLLLTLLEDRCPEDDQKADEGVCGCGVPDVDADSDGIMDCVDPCNSAGDPTVGGQCGCPGDAPAPAGTVCTDAPCGAGTCDGAGHCVAEPGECGDAFTAASCQLYQLTTGSRVICTADSSWDGARNTCAALTGMRLVQIDSVEENALISGLLDAPGWTGGNDLAVEGTWRWDSRLLGPSSGPQFWQGGADGSPYFGRYTNWGRGEPDAADASDCQLLEPASSGGTWSDARCDDAHPFICQRNGLPPDITAPEGESGHESLGQAPDTTDYSNCTPTPEAVPELIVLPDGGVDNSAVYARFEACSQCQGEADLDGLDWEVECTPPQSDACTQSATPPAPTDLCTRWEAELEDEQEFICPLASVRSLVGCSENADCQPGDHCGLVFACDGTFAPCIEDDDCPDVNGSPGYCRGLRLCGTPDPTCPLLDPSDERCGETVLCQDRTDYDNEVTELNEELVPLPFNPATQFCDEQNNCSPNVPDNPITLPEDPPCVDDLGNPLAVCPDSPSNLWCHYDVPQEITPRTVDSPAAGGDAGTSQVGFYFEPSLGMYYDVEPGPLALMKFKVGAHAKLTAGAKLNLFGISDNLDVIDVQASIDAGLSDRSGEEICGVEADAYAKLFGLNLLPTSFGISEPDDAQETACIEALKSWDEQVERMRKAYSDARELLRQYYALPDGENFAAGAGGWCETLVNDPPFDFPPGDCATEAPEDTINRFIQFYHDQVDALGVDALTDGGVDDLAAAADAAFGANLDFGEMPSNSDEVTLFQTVFFVGPVPATMQVLLVTSYGINIEPVAAFKPGDTFKAMLAPTNQYARANDPFAKIGIAGGPTASASVGMFVGAGIDAPGIGATLGVLGSLELGQISFPVEAAAGIAVASSEDRRHIEGDLPADLDPTYVRVDEPAFAPKRFHLEALTQYGADLNIDKLLSGSLSLRLKLKFLFFSKTWRKKIAEWNGLCPRPDGTRDAWCDTEIFGARTGVPLPVEWGTVQMPTTLFRLAPIPANAYRDEGTASVSLDRVAEFFYDSLCVCRDPGEPCYRDGDCCDETHTCWSDPALAGDEVCSGCRGLLDSCNNDGDCCDPDHICSDAPVGDCQGSCTPDPDCEVDLDNGILCFCSNCETVYPQTKVCRPERVIIR